MEKFERLTNDSLEWLAKHEDFKDYLYESLGKMLNEHRKVVLAFMKYEDFPEKHNLTLERVAELALADKCSCDNCFYKLKSEAWKY